MTGKELVLKFNSAIASQGSWYQRLTWTVTLPVSYAVYRECVSHREGFVTLRYADANGREMVKRQRDKRGPSYPPYAIGEPVSERASERFFPVAPHMFYDTRCA